MFNDLRCPRKAATLLFSHAPNIKHGPPRRKQDQNPRDKVQRIIKTRATSSTPWKFAGSVSLHKKRSGIIKRNTLEVSTGDNKTKPSFDPNYKVMGRHEEPQTALIMSSLPSWIRAVSSGRSCRRYAAESLDGCCKSHRNVLRVVTSDCSVS